MGIVFGYGGAAGGHMFLHERHYSVHALPAAGVIMWCRWPEDAARRCLELTCWARYGGGIGCVNLAIYNARPHRVIAGEVHPFHIVPG